MEQDDFMDLSSSDLGQLPETKKQLAIKTKHLLVNDNNITVLPRYVGVFSNLVSLDISNNQLQHISEEIVHLSHLQSFEARNNCLDDESIPKEFSDLLSLININLSGNRLTEIPSQFFSLSYLECLSLGGNRIKSVPKDIRNLSRLV